MKEYVNPELEVIEFNAEATITTNTGITSGGDDGDL